MPHLVKLKESCELMSLEAALQADRNNLDGAVNSVVDSVGLGKLTAEGACYDIFACPDRLPIHYLRKVSNAFSTILSSMTNN